MYWGYIVEGLGLGSIGCWESEEGGVWEMYKG